MLYQLDFHKAHLAFSQLSDVLWTGWDGWQGRSIHVNQRTDQIKCTFSGSSQQVAVTHLALA
jgi:hypothetical protein